VESRPYDLRWAWADRISFNVAYGEAEEQFADLRAAAVGRPAVVSFARLGLVALSLITLAIDVGLAAIGVWLIFIVGGVAQIVAGVVALAIAAALMPRPERLPKDATRVALRDRPELERLVRRVAEAIGAPVPATVVFTMEFRSASGTYGLLNRRVLGIGVPLWLSLSTREQIALLAHDLGHFVDRDPRRSVMTAYALQFFLHLERLTRPVRSTINVSRRTAGRGAAGGRMSTGGGGAAMLGELVMTAIFGVFNLVATVGILIVMWLSRRDSYRAEYADDAATAHAAGSVAAVSAIDTLMFRDACMTVLQRAMRSDGPEQWRDAVVASRAGLGERLPRLRQLSMRTEASLLASHPPTGLRSQLIESRPAEVGALTPNPHETAGIDREMAAEYRELRGSISTLM
jgi:Zn-dependent protease with chaperone function